MKLTSKQRQLVKEYIKKIQTKKKLNEGNVDQNKIYRYFGNDPDFIIDQILDYLDFLLEDMNIDS
jgi:tRNA A37 threonylcarbamoyladenosine dehydratase